MSVAYFGVRWEAPAYQHLRPCRIPVGAECFYCDERISTGESGVILPIIAAGGGMDVRPAHIECELRAAAGSTRHLEGRCSCFTGDVADDRDDRTWRAQGIETMSWLVEHGR